MFPSLPLVDLLTISLKKIWLVGTTTKVVQESVVSCMNIHTHTHTYTLKNLAYHCLSMGRGTKDSSKHQILGHMFWQIEKTYVSP